MVGFHGRIMLVSEREDVRAELEPILRRGAHLPVTVTDGGEAMRLLEDGVVPDLLITDAGSPRALEGLDYVWRFRRVNRVGRHLAVVEGGAPFAEGALREGTTPLPRPFDADEVERCVREAIAWADRDLRAMRGEIFRRVDRLEREMRDLQRETVHALALTIAARDPYVHGHAARVAALCDAVAVGLGLPAADAERLHAAALLHEIGKGAVPLELLHKTEPLAPEELERIRGHAHMGAEILRSVASLGPVAALVELQGTDHAAVAGLEGRAGDVLPAGILRACDVWDAMASERSYRGAETREYRERVLRAGAGTRFHPDAVRALLRLIPRDPRPASRTA